jgi:NAD(P)H-nitrite reductase large subunit
MDPDQEICLCFHVSLRKLQQFLRVEKPRRASQLHECFGAGTGCGWCRPFLEQLFVAAEHHDETVLPHPHDYAQQRERYLEQRPASSRVNAQRPTDERRDAELG